MILRRTFGLAVLVIIAGVVLADEQDKPVRVLLETEKGEITVEVDPSKAPISVANFLRYVDGGFYTDARFHRTVTLKNQPKDEVKIEVIQASLNPAKGKSGFPAIKLERTRDTGLKHLDGTLSMARSGPDTARSSFSICINDQPSLDFAGKRNADGQGFAAFGRVIKGMDVVRKIQAEPAEGQNLRPPIRIIKATRVP
jgi:peptidyl-prolyl cis-trans isomerase A (cyclophilin A)